MALSLFSQKSFCQVHVYDLEQINKLNSTQFQEINSDPYNVPTPNQSSLGTFGIIPVSPYTGKADILIPIFSTSQRDVKLDVKLSYDTSGLLINQLPGWTGHNWTLFAGGAITRKINGRPDEISYKGTNAGTDIFFQYNKDNIYIMTNHAYNLISELQDAGLYDSFLDQISEQNYYNQQVIDEYHRTLDCQLMDAKRS